MKKKLASFVVLLLCSSAAFSQNYISGIVSLYESNAGGESTTVAEGASMIFNNSIFYEQANFINLGDSIAVSADTATLALSGTSAQTVTGRFKLGAFTIFNAAPTSIVSGTVPTMVTMLDSVTFESVNGATLTANDLLTLRSTIFKTARLADVTKDNTLTGNTVVGDVIVERFIPSKRAWRLLAPPTTGGGHSSQTIHDGWQEGGTPWIFGTAVTPAVNPNPGYGTMLTKPDNGTASGYDDGVKGSYAYSFRSYSSTGLISSPLNTDATSFSDTLAYLVEIRGDRSVLPANQTQTTTPSTSTNLRSRGPLKTGDVTTTVQNSNGSFMGVANPYACTIDFSKLSSTGLKNGYYVWDPAIGTLGAWVYIDASDYSAIPSGGSYTSAATNKFIESGQAILVSTSNNTVGSTGSLTFTEASKNPSNTASVFREGEGSSINLNLYKTSDSTPLILDGTAAVFNPAFSNVVDEDDILKPGNITENVSFYNTGKFLMKEKRNIPTATDTLFLQLWKTSQQKYRFAMQAMNMPVAVKPYLDDKYLNTLTAINDTTAYDFAINGDPASSATTRFMIVFQQASILPVSSAFVEAKPQANGVAVSWMVQNETNMNGYVVEKSTDGINFSVVGTVAAKPGSNTMSAYNLFDASPSLGVNDYRIKMINANGTFSYTMVAEVTITQAGMMTVTVSPNPVRNGKMVIHFANATRGKYAVEALNSNGRIVASKDIEHAGGTASYALPEKFVAGGLYDVNIRNANTGFVKTVKVIVIP